MTPTAVPTLAPTAMPTTAPTKATCLGNSITFGAGFGGCASYDPHRGTWSNYKYCASDQEHATGLYAYEVCPECGFCENATAAPTASPTTAPTAAPTVTPTAAPTAAPTASPTAALTS